MRYVFAFLGLLVVVLVGSYWGVNLLRPSLDSDSRSALQQDGKAHQFLQTARGTIHFRDEGSKQAPTIVLVHGFSTPSFVYDDFFEPLTEAGFRVISFDVFGRGFSDRPNMPFDEDLFVGQVLGVINGLNVSGPVHLVGYSMGGGVVADFAARHPELVASVTLLAPAGFTDVDSLPSFLTAPIIGDWVFRVLGPQLMEARLEDGLELAPNPDQFIAQFRERAEYAGYYESLLSTIRHYPLANREPEHLTLVAAGVPVYSVWGDKDTVITIDGKDNLLKWNPSAIVKVIEGGTHSITYSHPDEITQFIIGNLESSTSPLSY